MALLLLVGTILFLIKCGITPGTMLLWLENLLLSIVLRIEEADCQIRVKTPIVISNHVSWMDIVYLFTRLQPLSFVAK
jgi:1-acyl-sn-glycerol-3-phosphate acyltransferase